MRCKRRAAGDGFVPGDRNVGRRAWEVRFGCTHLSMGTSVAQPANSMHQSKQFLLAGGLLTGVASLLHVAIILGGPDWYRFFGAGEGMARLAARGSTYPAVLTAGIAAILGVWTLYALSGVGIVRRLPSLRLALGLIAAIYLARGLLGIPVVLTVEHPYLQELRARPTFMVISSAICVGLGFCYAVGAVGVRNQTLSTRA